MEITNYNFLGSVINNINFEILEHGYLNGDSNWKFYNVSSPFNRLYFITEGEGYIENESERVVMKKGGIYLIPLHSINNYICDYSIQKFYIHFRLEIFGGRDIFETTERCMLISEKSLFNANKLKQMFVSRKIDDILELKAYFLQVVSKIAHNYLDYQHLNIETGYKYQQAYAYIKNNCSAGISVNELAKHMNISVSGLEKSFRQDTGETLKNYINRKLVERAKEKLLLTDMNIKEISYLLKFSDEFYFSRYFKKHTGLSPREYRKHNKFV